MRKTYKCLGGCGKKVSVKMKHKKKTKGIPVCAVCFAEVFVDFHFKKWEQKER